MSFWIAYILTRPLGASIGDYLSQPHQDGRPGLGTTGTTALFLATILALVTYLTITKRDQTPPEIALGAAPDGKPHPAGADKRLQVSAQEA